MMTLVTALFCEITSACIGFFVRAGDRSAPMLRNFGDYLLLAAAIIGVFLIMMTPIVVRRKRSNPPLGIVIAAFVIGGLPWLTMAMRAME
jgi:RsiW-degrading membrane proteinase PrsW (M82 family)